MRIFNSSRRPYLCPAIQETLEPFASREIAYEWEDRVQGCPLGDACKCEISMTVEEPAAEEPEALAGPRSRSSASRKSSAKEESPDALEPTPEPADEK